jgi:hypothetical protein
LARGPAGRHRHHVPCRTGTVALDLSLQTHRPQICHASAVILGLRQRSSKPSRA